MPPSKGPLEGTRVVELAGLGPVPFAAMQLADLGADVVRVDRPRGTGDLVRDPQKEILFRGRRSIAVDLARPDGAATVRRLCMSADVLLEGNRPGVAERLGVGPDACLLSNPGLVYARATGWGQEGPLAARAGHDLTYTALSGALSTFGEAGRKPVPALNLVSDFGGGGTFLVIGVLAALIERTRSGRGQVVDAAMIDGTSYLLASVFTMVNAGEWRHRRGHNLIDGGAPFYDTYECRDGGYVAVAALEPKFWRVLVERLGLDIDPSSQWDESTWPALKNLLATTFAGRERDEWTALLEGVDACTAPVLTLAEAPHHPHLAQRGTHLARGEGVEPAVAPRFSRTPGAVGAAPQAPGASTREVLAERGFDQAEITRLIADKVVVQAAEEGA
jgi:alpha-methylacyl-CoA racemase